MRENGFLGAAPSLGVVSDLLKAKPSEEVFVAKQAESVREVIARMKAHGISQLPVVSGTQLVGAVAEVDLLRYLVSGEYSLDSEIGGLVESDYATVSTHTKLELVQGLLSDARMAVVTEQDRVVGVITKIALIDYLARRG